MALCEAEKHAEDAKRAQQVLQAVAQQIQTNVHKKVAGVVSRCLSAVFSEPYELRIEFERKRGRTEARFVYLRNGRKVNPKVASGGVGEVASLALRLASLVLAVPTPRKLLVLDEPFGGLSEKNLGRVGILLETLAEELGTQFLVVTHDEGLKVGTVVEV